MTAGDVRAVPATGADAPLTAGALTLAEAAQRLYGPILDHMLSEAAQFDAVDTEIALMRLWLKQTLSESRDGDEPARIEHAEKLMMRMFTQIVRAVSVKYQLSAKNATDFMMALEAMAKYVHEEVMAPVAEEDL